MRRALLFASAVFLLPLLAAHVAADCSQAQDRFISSFDAKYALRSADRTFAEDGARTLVAVRSSSGRSFYRVSEVSALPSSRCRITPVYVQSDDSTKNIPRFSHSLLRCGGASRIIIH